MVYYVNIFKWNMMHYVRILALNCFCFYNVMLIYSSGIMMHYVRILGLNSFFLCFIMFTNEIK